MLFKKKIHKDHTKKYWEDVAKLELPQIMEKICHNFTYDDFVSKKDSIIFELDIRFDQNQTVLDLACGLGRTCRWVSPKVKKYIGIDHIKKMVELAEKINSDVDNAEFIRNNGKKIPLPKNSIDMAYSEIAFQHMPKKTQKKYIKEMSRVLKSGGKFYVQLPKSEFYETGWKKHELDDLFDGWHKRLVSLSNKNYDAYYTIVATNS